MDGKYTNKSAPKPPRCHSCARPMQLLQQNITNWRAALGTIAECLEHARQCEWYAARTNGAENAGSLVSEYVCEPSPTNTLRRRGLLETKRARLNAEGKWPTAELAMPFRLEISEARR